MFLHHRDYILPKLSKVFLILRFIVLFIIFSTSVCAKESTQKITLQLNGKYSFEFAGYIAAKEKGYYKEAGLDVDLKEAEHDVNPITAVLQGRADYGIGLSNLIFERIKGSPIVLLSNDFKHSSMVLITRPGIRSPSQLKGKKIMGANGQTMPVEIQYMLSKFGLDKNDVDWITRAFDITDLIEGRADAIIASITNLPVPDGTTQIKYNILDPANYGIDFYGNSLFTSNTQLKHDFWITEGLLEASKKGWNYALTHPDEIIAIIIQKYSQTKTRKMLEYEARETTKIEQG